MHPLTTRSSTCPQKTQTFPTPNSRLHETGCFLGDLPDYGKNYPSIQKGVFLYEISSRILIILDLPRWRAAGLSDPPALSPLQSMALCCCFIALSTGILKAESIRKSPFFLDLHSHHSVCGPGRTHSGILAIGPYVGSIIIICVISTYLVFGISALVTQILMKKKEDKRHG